MSTNFNESFYLSNNPDVVLAISQGFFGSALQHFNLFGGKELRNPNSTFDSNYYSVQNPDVLAAVSSGVFSSAFAHFQAFGVSENRAPTQSFANFDAAGYLEANTDVAAAVTAGTVGSALEHFMAFGSAEGRTGSGITENVTNPGSNFTLTTSTNQVTGGVDNLTGSDNNDTFIALADAALDQSDIVDGGAGTDTLKARYNLDAASENYTASVVNVENLSIDVDDGNTAAGHALNFNVSGFTGLSNVTVTDFDSTAASEDTITVSNIALGTTVGVKNGDANARSTFEYSSVTGATDEATLNLEAAKADRVTIAGIETVTVNAVSGSSTLDQIKAAAATELKVTGSGNVTLTSVDAATATGLKTIDASAATGNVSVADVIAGTVTITGGSGDDTFSLGDNTAFTSADTVTGGAGNDTVKVLQGTFTSAYSKLTGVENIELEDDTATTNTTHAISGTISSEITNFIIDANDSANDGNALTVNVTNMDSGDTVTINDASSDSANNDGVDITGTLTTNGASDILNLTFQGIGAVTTGGVTTGAEQLTFDQFETINVASNANSTGTVTTNGAEDLSAQAATNVVFTGSAALTINTLTNTSSLTTVDASAMTGKLTISSISAASNLSLTAAQADTTITMVGLNASDTIVGGAGTKDKVIATSVTGLTATTGDLNVTNIETVELRTTGANTINGSKLSGVNEVSVSSSAAGTQTFTNLAAGVAIGIGDSADTVDSGNTISASLADATGSSDAISFNVDTTEAADTSVSLTTADIETVTLAMDSTSGNTNNSQVLLTNAAAANVVVTGGGASQVLTINALNKATTSFDSTGFTGDIVTTAAAATGAVTIATKGAGTTSHSITGSAQGDTITVGSTGAVAYTVDGGAGTDTLNMTVTTGFVSMANISNVENINMDVAAGVDITLSNVAGINDAALNNLVITGGNTLSTYKTGAVTGAATTETIDASAFTGNIDLLLTEAAIDAGATVTISAGSLGTDNVSFTATNSATLALNTSGVDVINIKEATGASTVSLTNSDAGLISLDSDQAITLTGMSAGQSIQLGLSTIGAAQLTAVNGVEAATVTATYASVSGSSDAATIRLADTDAGTATAIVDMDGIETITLNHVARTGTTFENHSFSLAGSVNATNKIAVVMTGGNAANTVTFAASGAVSDITSIDASDSLSAISVNAAARANTGTMTITGTAAADTIAMESTGDVLTGGSGSDTLAIAKNAILGGLNVDLSSTTDQIVSFNGGATSGTVLGFESADASGYAGSFGAQLTGSDAANTFTGTANADVVSGGAGADVITGGDGVDTITGGTGDDDFTVAIGLGDLDVITDFAAGDDLAINVTTPAANTYFEGAVGLVAATDELAVITGATIANAAILYINGIFAANTEVVIVFLDSDTSTAKLYYDADGENGGADGTELVNFTGITTTTELAAAFGSNADFLLT